MANQIFILDPSDKTPQAVTPLTFAGLGLKERADLEEWIKVNPDILGTKLLVIKDEYDRFEKSDKRLDLLALDDLGKLVIIELKRDAAGSLADLQAVRYAAFCSTLTLSEVVDLLAEYAEISVESAKQRVQEFVTNAPTELLVNGEFAKLDNKPRIILAAGGFDDQELTSCVLWLRSFGVDISCVELAPYQIGDGKHLILVPRVIIPLPEAKVYLMGTEKKEAEQERPAGGKRENYTKESLEVLDSCFELIRGIAPGAQPSYKQQFVGITLNGQANNFAQFFPRKQLIKAHAFVVDRDVWVKKLEQAGVETLPGGELDGSARFRLKIADVSEHHDLLIELFTAAYQNYG